MSDQRTLSEVGHSQESCEQCSLFALCFAQDMDSGQREQLNASVKRQQPLKRGEHLFHGGQRMKGVVVLRSGSIKGYDLTQDGDEIVSGFFLPGDAIGLDSLSSHAHSGFAEALEDSRYCEIPIRDFERMLEESARLNQVMLKLLSEEMAETRRLLLVVGRLDAKTRVAMFLLSLSRRLARRKQDPDRFRLTMDRRDIANYLGLTIETVSRTLTGFQREGIIEVRGKLVNVLDRDQLVGLARQALPESDLSEEARSSQSEC